MKGAKTKIKSNNTKNINRPIYSFFPKSNCAANIPDNASDFYTQLLPKTPQQSADSESSVQSSANDIEQLKEKLEQVQIENVKLRNELSKMRTDFNGLLKVHKETCRLYVNKEIKIKALEKKIVPEGELLYESFKSVLGEEVVIKLRKLQDSVSSDSTLILNCVRGLFRNTQELQSMSACGLSENVRMPREKREILDAIFLERLNSIEMKDDERNKRYIRLNRLINQAISNSKPSVSYHVGFFN